MAASVACSATRSRATSTGSWAGGPARRWRSRQPGPPLGHVDPSRHGSGSSGPCRPWSRRLAKTACKEVLQRYVGIMSSEVRLDATRPARPGPPAAGAHPRPAARVRPGHRDHPGRATRPVDRRDQLPPAASSRRTGSWSTTRSATWAASAGGRPRTSAPSLDSMALARRGRGLPARGCRPVRGAGRPLARRVSPLPAAVARVGHAQRLAAAADRRRGDRAAQRGDLRADRPLPRDDAEVGRTPTTPRRSCVQVHILPFPAAPEEDER